MADEWYVGSNGKQSGPFSVTQLKQMAASGHLQKTHLIWKKGMSGWIPCSSVKGLFPAPPPVSTMPLSVEGGLTASDPSGAVGDVYTGQMPGDSGVPNRAAAPDDDEPSLELADFMPRVGAALLDGIFVGLISCIPTIGMAVVLAAANANNPQGADATVILTNICSNIIGFIVGAIYYVSLDCSAKQGTWGKQIVGLKVTDLDGRRISAGRAFGRFLARYLSGCTCGIGFLLPLFTKQRQTLHDLICGCVVLNK